MITVGLIVELALKSVVVAGVGLGVLRLTRTRSAAERSWIGHAGLIALILLVPAALLLPTWNPLPTSLEPARVTAAVGAPRVFLPELARSDTADKLPPGSIRGGTARSSESPALPAAGELAVWTYLALLGALLAAMIVAVVRLSGMHRRANVLVDGTWLAALAQAQRRMGFKHGTALLVSDELRSPVSWGMMRPIILLNSAAVAAAHEAEPIIAHELAHVARLDWAKLLIARLACALFWFNPLVWRLARECHQLREEAADDAVLLGDVDGADYASLLVSAARHDNPALLLAAHGVAPAKDSLKRRITRVLNRESARNPATRAWVALCLIVLLGIAGPLAALDPMSRPERLNAAPAVTTPAAPPAVAKAASARTPHTFTGALHGNSNSVIVSDDEDDQGTEGNEQANRVIGARAIGLTPDYIAEMRAAGFANASMDDLMAARAVGVTPGFAAEMSRFAPGVDLNTLVGAKAVGLSPAFYGEMRGFYPHVSLDDAVGLAAVGIDGPYARAMRALFPGLSADQLQELGATGVTPELVGAMRAEGISARDPDAAIQGRLFAHHRGKLRAGRGDVAVAISPGGSAIRVKSAGPRGATAVAISRGGRAINVSGPDGNVAIAVPPDDSGD